MNKFVFRAECEHDVNMLTQTIANDLGGFVASMVIKPHPMVDIPDVGVVVHFNGTKDNLIDLMRLVPDGHVMYQTLTDDQAKVDAVATRGFTGDVELSRNYSL